MARKATKKPVQSVQRRKISVRAPDSAASSPALPPSAGTSLPATIPPHIVAETALQMRQHKRRWTGLPKKSKIRAKAATICAMKIQGHSTDEIAEHLGLKPASVRQYMWIAGKNGWLTTQDPHDIAEYELTHRVVSNLDELLHARSAITGLPDREVTLESAKGLGVFRDHNKPQEEINQQANMLTINIITPEGVRGEVRPGTTRGTPAYLEGDIVQKSLPE